MQKLGTRVVLATTYHLQTNGLIERMNRTLIGLIKKICIDQQSKWVETLPLLEFAYNNSLHWVTKISPFKAVQGVDPLVPSLLLLLVAESYLLPKTYAEQVHRWLQTIWASLKKSEERENRQIETRENIRRGPSRRIQESNEVLCWRFQLTPTRGGKRKQELSYEGPFRMSKMLKDSVAELKGLPIEAPTLINTQFLRQYKQNPETEQLRSRTVPSEPVTLLVS